MEKTRLFQRPSAAGLIQRMTSKVALSAAATLLFAAGCSVSPTGSDLSQSEPGTCTDLPSSVAQRWIAFDSERGSNQRDLYLARADGSRVVRLTDDPGDEREPAFSPDGKQLAYVSDASGTAQLFVLGLEDGSVTQLTQRNGDVSRPTWSRDGTKLFYYSAPGLWVIDADGDRSLEIAETRTDYGYTVPSDYAFSPGEKTLVFSTSSAIHSIDVGSSAGDERQVVKSTTTTEQTPAVSPDGRRVAYSVFCSTGTRIEVVPLASSSQACKGAQVTDERDGDARRPAWGPDDYLAFERTPAGGAAKDAESRIAIAREGVAACDVLRGAGRERNPAWAPEGFEPK